jgi:predicted DNA-binding transcriptional regulator YafY
VRATIEFVYKGDRRSVDPYAVFFTNGYWYVAGFDHERGEQRTFRVDRIDGDMTAGKHGSFVVPESFRAADVLPAPWQLPGDEPVTAEVRITDPSLAAFVVESMGDLAEVAAADDGSSIVRFEVRNRGAFRSWLFGMLDDAEVLGPESLRADTIEWLRGMAK